MNKSLLAACLSLTLGLAATAAQAHGKGPGAHQHGVAKLAVAVDGEMLEIRLDSPLDNLLGFERAPRTDRERQAVRQMAQRFHSGEVFTPTPAAQCSIAGAELSSDVLAPALLAQAEAAGTEAAAAPQAKKDGHADIEATLRWRCANPGALKSVDVGLFKAFSRFRQIDTAVAAAGGQRGLRLTRQQTLVSW